MDTIYSFLSNDFSGLFIGLAVLVIGFLAFRRSTTTVRKATFGLLGLAGLVLTIGAVSHVVRLGALDKRYPPPGVMVDLGGYDVHVLAEGPAGGPPVVLFGGGHAGGYAFLDLHNALKTDHRSILIDRPGTGWSDTGPFPRTTALEVDEVMAVLEATGEQGTVHIRRAFIRRPPCRQYCAAAPATDSSSCIARPDATRRHLLWARPWRACVLRQDGTHERHTACVRFLHIAWW